jgi:L-asparagine transporter-like permease
MWSAIKKYVLKLFVVIPSLAVLSVVTKGTGSILLGLVAFAMAASFLTCAFTYVETRGAFRPSLRFFWHLTKGYIVLPVAALAFVIWVMFFDDSPWWAILSTVVFALVVKIVSGWVRTVAEKRHQRRLSNQASRYHRYRGRY